MKPIKVTIPGRLRPYLKGLLKRGLHGSTEQEVATRLIEAKLQDLVSSSYFSKHDATVEILNGD